MKDLSLEKPEELYALYMNFYKKKDFSKEDLSTLVEFFNSLNNNSFIEKPENLPDKPLYKIFLTFSENKESAEGCYFNNIKDRQSYGEMKLLRREENNG